MTLTEFLEFFLLNGADSLIHPQEGSGFFLYAPAFFYSTIFVVLLIVFIFGKNALRNDSKKIAAVLTLISLGAVMFLESVVVYNPLFAKVFPQIQENMTGVLRGQINLWPFVVVLAGFLCFYLLTTIEDEKAKRRTYIFIIALSLFIDLLVFVVLESFLSHILETLTSSQKSIFFASSNKIRLHFFKDMALAYPIINFLVITAILSYDLLKKRFNDKNSFKAAFIIVAFILPLLGISLHNEWLPQGRQPLVRDSYRKSSYLERRECVDGLVDRYDLNYRTLYAGEGWYDRDYARNWKLIAETELNVEKKEKALFSYREFDNPYTGVLRGLFSKDKAFNHSNLFPPLAEEIPDNVAALKLLGVKYVVSADEPINSPSLTYKGECSSESGPVEKSGMTPQEKEGGSFFVYELNDPVKIAFLAGTCKTLSPAEAIKNIYHGGETPWVDNTVYLENCPDWENKTDSSGFPDEASIKEETYNTVGIETKTTADKHLVLSYVHRSGWRAFVDGRETAVLKAYGGLMAVELPAGRHTVEFEYSPKYAYLGFLITVLAVLLSPLVKKYF